MARPCTYKVFLSFRGEDTRKGFTSHLYTALVNRGITTYIDDKNLHKGDLISDELLKAIEESMFAVIVLSPNYASSTWCLDELHKIVECNNYLGLQIVAVFYHVKPCDVRHQIGAFEEAFKKHELRFGKEGDRVRRWRNALTQVVSYSNWDSERFENEAILVESITQHIHERLIMKLPSSMKNLVGIDSRLEEVIRHIGLGGNDVRFIGICGMGGIGKTTIARRVYETIRSEFKVSCFLADVRERSERRGIVQIQKQLLDCMNINSDTRFDDEFEGKGIICDSLCHKKVLLVLDDVDDGGLLENLAGEQDWFGPGSRIIITTRDTHVLEVHGATYRICKVEGLEQDEALELFCLRAFKRPKPEEGYMDLSQEVVKYCDGLPLALVVLGSHLCGQTIDVWRSAIEKIKSFPHDKIFNTLKISYDGLDHSEKNIFLDIACFFKGREKDYATNIWKRCGYHVEASIATLINKSLLTIGEYYKETLEMHDLLEDMGKYIVIQECRDDPSKQSRLWSYKDVDLVLAQNKVLKKLEHLNLSNCHKLKQTPELCGALNLKTLDLSECKALNYIHPFLAHHKSLVELNLYGCSRLRRLPEFGEGMKQLSVLILTDTGIEELPTTPGKFAGVSKLDLSGCDKLTSLPLSLGCFVGLKELVLSRFMELSCVPYSTHGLESLTVEDYSDSPNIVGLLCSLSCFTSLSTLKLHVCFGTLSYNLGHLASLTDLDLSDNDFRQLPISILELPRLTRLQLYHCRFLEVLPEIPSSLRVLQADRCCSLVASKVYDAISKACCVFAESASQDREDFLQMLMPELYQEMPAWFEDQEEDNGVSLSSPSTEIIALALCFLLDGDKYSEEQPSVICNGKEFINTRLLKVSMSSYYKTLLILCLNGYSFSNLLCQDNRFQLQFPSDCCEIRVKRSGARWVCKQDVQLLKKRKYETGKRKATLKLNMDMISHSSASRNKMPVVDSPVYEEEVERATTLLASLRFASHST
ncbi:TMV resistance protein N-like isoform X3 [Arachis ipaensis]|uniref:TMV resistance protein N-like isoform X3 n=1 Tax=Arachis ipaensis TaxID=130454 RepID=UPI000A2B1C5B|nr:TMV resistance protein N-like isoform X3 [Arachis ipaensis]XP_025649486.1 TMV resistance protein N isoform X3 [Arachis hypogaea]